MKLFLRIIILGVCCRITTSIPDVYTNTWCVKTFAGADFAKGIAEEHGFSYHGLALSYEDHYIFKLAELPPKSNINRVDLTNKLMENEKVEWAGQMKVKTVKYKLNKKQKDAGSEIDEDQLTGTLHRSFRAKTHYGATPPKTKSPKLVQQSTSPYTSWVQPYAGPTKNHGQSSRDPSTYDAQFSDPLWINQWYLHDYRTAPGPVMDHNVVPVYRLTLKGKRVTGEGVVIAIVDEGIDNTHPDIRDSIREDLSFDFLAETPGLPKKLGKDEEHGIEVAGVIAMAANNAFCGVGVAYGAEIAALKAFGGPQVSTDYTFGAALGHARGSVHIYSNSWNRDSAGKFLERANHMEHESIRNGIQHGRGGRGAIYVFSAGNDKLVGDTCAFQAITNDKDVIVVAAANSRGKVFRYSQFCPNVFVAGYSADVDDREGVVTIGKRDTCSKAFTGTSAAAPIISSIIALTLQANPRLSYRDIQHLITMTAEVAPLADNPGKWQRNKAGFWVSQDFGFGLMNAENIVKLSTEWANVPPQVTCPGSFELRVPVEFSSVRPHISQLGTNACEHTGNPVRFLEKVTLTFTIEYPSKRGDLYIYLRSPQGTEVLMLAPRPKDESKRGFRNWSVTSAQTWGENPKGNWVVTIRNRNNQEDVAESSASGRKRKIWSLSKGITGSISNFKLTLHGMREQPYHMKYGHRKNYAPFTTS